jgi:hypothetical protein
MHQCLPSLLLLLLNLLLHLSLQVCSALADILVGL